MEGEGKLVAGTGAGSRSTGGRAGETVNAMPGAVGKGGADRCVGDAGHRPVVVDPSPEVGQLLAHHHRKLPPTAASELCRH